jgi:uncharacterized protein YdaU (DUF1376 family)
MKIEKKNSPKKKIIFLNRAKKSTLKNKKKVTFFLSVFWKRPGMRASFLHAWYRPIPILSQK